MPNGNSSPLRAMSKQSYGDMQVDACKWIKIIIVYTTVYMVATLGFSFCCYGGTCRGRLLSSAEKRSEVKSRTTQSSPAHTDRTSARAFHSTGHVPSKGGLSLTEFDFLTEDSTAK